MKKLIFSIAALAAIVVMGSCSQDSDLTSQKSSSKVDSVTVGLSINTGITVSESNSSMAKSIANVPVTRAAVATRATTNTIVNGKSTSIEDFAPTYPSSYTVYFVAKANSGAYTAGNIVRIKTVNTEDKTTLKNGSGSQIVYTENNIKIPAIEYDIYVTNYSTNFNVGDKWVTPSLPTNTKTLYLINNEAVTKDLSSSNNSDRNITVNLDNNYAAVAVAANDFVSNVVYNYSPKTYDETSKVYESSYSSNGINNSNITYTAISNWFYQYLYVGTGTTSTNSTLFIKNINGIKDGTTSNLNKGEISAGKIYQYTINDNYTGGTTDDTGGTTGGTGDGLTISVTPFTENGETSDLSVY